MWKRGMTPRHRSSRPRSSVLATFAAEATRFRCRRGTRFGREVVPEVWRSKATSSGSGDSESLFRGPPGSSIPTCPACGPVAVTLPTDTPRFEATASAVSKPAGGTRSATGRTSSSQRPSSGTGSEGSRGAATAAQATPRNNTAASGPAGSMEATTSSRPTPALRRSRPILPTASESSRRAKSGRPGAPMAASSGNPDATMPLTVRTLTDSMLTPYETDYRPDDRIRPRFVVADGGTAPLIRTADRRIKSRTGKR